MNPITAEYFSGSLRLTSQTVKQVVKIRRKRVTNKLNIIELCGYLDSTWKANSLQTLINNFTKGDHD